MIGADTETEVVVGMKLRPVEVLAIVVGDMDLPAETIALEVVV